MKKQTILLVVLGAILALVAIALYIPVQVDRVPAPDLLSGVRGVVTIGPTCPVMKDPPDDNCADKPYGAELEIVTDKNKSVAIFKAKESDGSFVVPLKPGNYIIKKMDSASQLPALGPHPFVVLDGEYVEIVLQMDSGIR